uniref:Uncharacterized protein n=1 Tax=Phenylobacterium glaciei TaxID=2803784 RepID=A0A974P1F9_9CAUL|nr:hypothetical protein JKL49_16855 [Phenylobacterium glaciei]
MNTGFDCPSRADIGTKHPTFIEVDTTTLTPRLRQVTAASDGTYAIEDASAPADTLVYAPNFDFSTYVTVDNTQGAGDLVRRTSAEVHGRYVVGPPVVIPKGHVTRFWIQDNAGTRGPRAWSPTTGPAPAGGSAVRLPHRHGRQLRLRRSLPGPRRRQGLGGAQHRAEVGASAVRAVQRLAGQVTRPPQPFHAYFRAARMSSSRAGVPAMRSRRG